MEYPFYTADVFTDTIFNGAQVAVFPAASGLDESQMQHTASELNLPATVFITPSEGENHFKMRVFSAQKEIDFAGHPVIATAHILAVTGAMETREGHNPLVLERKSGAIQSSVTVEAGVPNFIQFTMKSQPIVDRYVPTEPELAEILSLEVNDLENKKFTARLASCGFPYLIVPLRHYEGVRRARFNYKAWSESSAPAMAAQEILLFTGHVPGRETNFHGRLLGPNIALHDDPPIGAALPAFTGYLCSHEQIRKGTYSFSIDRGDERSRRSLLHLEMDNKQSDQLTIRVGGQAVVVVEGTMKIPPSNPLAF